MITAIVLKIVNNIFNKEFTENSFSIVVGWVVLVMLICSLTIDICIAKVAIMIAFGIN